MFNFVFHRISLGILLLMVGLIPAHVATAGVEWGKSLEDGMKEAEKTGKPVMLDFYTDWWGACRQLDAETFTDDRIVELSKKFITIKVNPENQEQPENMKALMQYEVTGYPTIVFASSDGGMIAKQTGLISPKDFEPVIEGALAKEEAFKEKLAELQETPDDAKLNAQVALIYLERTQLEKALLLSKEALKRDPKNRTGLMPNLHNQLGLAYAAKVEAAMAKKPEEIEMYFQKAVFHFRTVIDEYPKSDLNDSAQYYLGVTYAIKGNFDDAISVLEKLANHTADANIKHNAEVMLGRVKDLANAN